MGKWASLLKEHFGSPLLDGADKTAKTEVLTVLAVTEQRDIAGNDGAEDSHESDGGGAEEVRPHASRTREAGAGQQASVELSRFQARRDRLIRWGRSVDEAENIAQRLQIRDSEGDDRTLCLECYHWRPGRCVNSRQAGLSQPALSNDLAELLQRCQGFKQSR